MKYRVEIGWSRLKKSLIKAQIWRLGRSKILKSRGQFSKEIEIGSPFKVEYEEFWAL